jgi:hypothetical protein
MEVSRNCAFSSRSHLSLPLLFFCGLSLFLFDIEKACGLCYATIFALGHVLFITTTTIAAFDDSAPFRSPLSRAFGHQFRRLSSYFLMVPTSGDSVCVEQPTPTIQGLSVPCSIVLPEWLDGNLLAKRVLVIKTVIQFGMSKISMSLMQLSKTL